MTTRLIRLTGSALAALTIGSVALVAPVSAASAAPVATAATVKAAVAAPTGERNPKVSRSMTGIRASAYVGRYYNSRYEAKRKCIVRRESHGNYRIVSSGGTYRGAYQFNPSLARAAARKMGRSDLVGKSMNTWSRFDQDKAFWVIWNHGRGASNWPTRHGC